MRRWSVRSTIAASLVALALGACGPKNQAGEEAVTAQKPAMQEPAQLKTRPIKITARDFSFQGPNKVPSGWVTIRFQNTGTQTHFMFLTELPEGKTIDDYRNDVGPAFEKAWTELKGGADKAKVGQDLGAALPEWYLTSAKPMGGSGLVGPGGENTVTLKLEPGNYVMECYVRSPEGEFHGALGMLRTLTVTTADSGAQPPVADIDLTLTNNDIQVQGDVTPGRHTIAVHFQEQPQGGLGNDVHLVKLTPDTDMEKLRSWMDWMNLDGMQAPAPATFLGGVQEMPAGSTEYFEANLEPGRYAWISEPVRADGQLKEFTVE